MKGQAYSSPKARRTPVKASARKPLPYRQVLGVPSHGFKPAEHGKPSKAPRQGRFARFASVSMLASSRTASTGGVLLRAIFTANETRQQDSAHDKHDEMTPRTLCSVTPMEYSSAAGLQSSLPLTTQASTYPFVPEYLPGFRPNGRFLEHFKMRFARPASRMTAWPSLVRRRLSGLISRCK